MLHVTSDFPRSAFIPPRFAYIVRSIWSLSNGKGLSIPYGYADFDTPFDLLLIAGGPQLPDVQPRSEFLKWLQDQARGATRFGAVCNGDAVRVC
jgi:transcriptional regulator GlxA family with amidase domain